MESLELANSRLKDKLMEARLETNALRRASGLWREEMIEQETRSGEDNNEQQRQLGPVNRTTSATNGRKGVQDGGGGEEEGQRLCVSSDTNDKKLPVAKTRECNVENLTTNNNNVQTSYLSTTHERKPEQTKTVEPVDFRGETSCPVSGSARARERKATTVAWAREYASAALSTQAISRRRVSFPYEVTNDQAELVGALRRQVTQLQLEVQTVRAAALTAGPVEWPRVVPGDGNSDSNKGVLKPCFASENPTNTNNEAVAGGGGGGLITWRLRAQVQELSAKLATANNALAALRLQAQANQAATLELQREVLFLHRTGAHSAAVTTAVARVSARKTRPIVDTDHNRGDDGCGRQEEHGCLDHGPLHWFLWLWENLSRRRGRNKRTGGGVEEVIEEGWMGDCEEDEAWYREDRGGCGLHCVADEEASLLNEHDAQRAVW